MNKIKWVFMSKYKNSCMKSRQPVNYEAENIVELEEEFHKAVDDYLEFCKEFDFIWRIKR